MGTANSTQSSFLVLRVSGKAGAEFLTATIENNVYKCYTFKKWFIYNKFVSVIFKEECVLSLKKDQIYMNMIKLVYTLILSIVVVLAILLAIYANKRRKMPGANYFILLMLVSAVYSATYIGEISSSTLTGALFWYDAEYIVIPLQHYIWAIMSLEFANIDNRKLRLAKYALLYHPVTYYIIYFTNNWHHKYVSKFSFESNGFFPVIVTEKGVLFTAMIVSGTFLGVISTLFYIRGYIKAHRIQKYVYITMLIAAIFPWVAVYMNATDTRYLGIDYVPVVAVVSGVLYLLGIFHFRLFNTVPIATEIIFNQSKEGLMLVDIMDNIISANDAFLAIFPDYKKSSENFPLTAFIKKHPELEAIDEGKAVFDFTLGQGEEKKFFSVFVTGIYQQDNFEIGKIITIQDVTQYVNTQKQLEYLASRAMAMAETNEISYLQAQIKPHFINNTLNVIASMVTRAPAEAKIMLTNLSEYLMNCCYFDEETPMNPIQKELEIVNTYVSIERARFGNRLKFHILYDQLPFVQIPKLTLQPLVENAIRHGITKKAAGGTVWLEIIYDNDVVHFEIRDDGIGMEQEKIKTLMDSNIKHKSVGLTNINRRLMKYYQKGLSISSRVGEGTSVTFEIPCNKSNVLTKDVTL